MHTTGYTYGFQNHEEYVLEFAQPLLTIFEHFVSTLKGSGNEARLKRVEEEAKGNSYLEKTTFTQLTLMSQWSINRQSGTPVESCHNTRGHTGYFPVVLL